MNMKMSSGSMIPCSLVNM